MLTGCLTQEDPIGYAGGSNLYADVGNNPVSHTDPFGLLALDALNVHGDADFQEGVAKACEGEAMRAPMAHRDTLHRLASFKKLAAGKSREG